MTKNPNAGAVQVLPEYIPDNLGAPFTVVLKNSVRQTGDENSGDCSIVIPNLKGLLETIAVTRLIVPRKLSGPEMKFVRKALDIKSKDLARIIGISAEHMSRVETGEKVLAPSTEKLARIAILLNHFRTPEEVDEKAKDDEALGQRLAKLRSAMDNLQAIMNEMDISPVHDANEELVLSFSLKEKEARSGSEEDWAQLSAAA